MHLPGYNQISSFNCYSNIAFQMKKSDFENRLDLKVVEDTRAPIEKFDNINDFYTYCNGLTDSITNKEYGGSAYFQNSQVTLLGKLKSIDGNAYIENSKLKPSDFDNIIVKRKIVVYI